MSITVGELLDAAAAVDRQVNLDPAELAQLEYQAKRAGITLGELITCYAVHNVGRRPTPD